MDDHDAEATSLRRQCWDTRTSAGTVWNGIRPPRCRGSNRPPEVATCRPRARSGGCTHWVMGWRQTRARPCAGLAWRQKGGDALGQSMLAESYSFGDGVPKDVSQAVRWWRAAAEQGHDVSARNLAVAYRDGEGVVKDRTQAIRWSERAAELGNAQAAHDLATLYYGSTTRSVRTITTSSIRTPGS